MRTTAVSVSFCTTRNDQEVNQRAKRTKRVRVFERVRACLSVCVRVFMNARVRSSLFVYKSVCACVRLCVCVCVHERPV